MQGFCLCYHFFCPKSLIINDLIGKRVLKVSKMGIIADIKFSNFGNFQIFSDTARKKL